MPLKRIIVYIAFILSILFINACTEDVSKNRNFSKFAGTIWKTKVPIAIPSSGTDVASRECTVEYEQAFAKGTANRNYFDGKNLAEAILPIGTVVRVERLLQIVSEEGGLYVEMSIESGVNKGKKFRAPDSLFAPNRFLHPEVHPDASDTWAVASDKLESL